VRVERLQNFISYTYGWCLLHSRVFTNPEHSGLELSGGLYCRSTFSTRVVVFAPLTLDLTTTSRSSIVTSQTTVIDRVSLVEGAKPTTLANMTTMATGTKVAELVEMY
jgi:hypothetical protein